MSHCCIQTLPFICHIVIYRHCHSYVTLLYTLPLHTNGNVCIQQCDIWMARPVHSNARSATEIHSRQLLWHSNGNAMIHNMFTYQWLYVYIPMVMPVCTNAFTYQWQCICIPIPVLPQIYTRTDIHGNTSDTEILDTHHRLRYSNVCTATNVHTPRYSRQYLKHRNTWYSPSPQIQQCLHCRRHTHRRMYMATPQTQKYLRHTNDSDAAMSAMPQTYTADNCLYTPMAMPWHTICLHNNDNDCMCQCLFILMTVPLQANACRATEKHTDR